MSTAFRLVNYEELDFLLLGDDELTGYTGTQGATGVTGQQGSTGSTGASPHLYVYYNSFGNMTPNQFLQHSGQTSSENAAQLIIGKAGKFTQMNLYHDAMPSNSWTYTLRINGVNTSLVITSASVGYTFEIRDVFFTENDQFSVLASSIGGGVPTFITLEYTHV